MTKAFKLRNDKHVIIYTDSRYAFASTHIYRANYQERRVFMAEEKTIKIKQGILDLLQAFW